MAGINVSSYVKINVNLLKYFELNNYSIYFNDSLIKRKSLFSINMYLWKSSFIGFFYSNKGICF